MRIINTSFYKQVIETHHLPIGDFYFFETFVFAEIKEGAHIDFKSSKVFFELTNSFYSGNQSYGYISNRINQFSSSPLDFAKYSKELNSVVSFCAITYNNHLDKMNAEIEKRFSEKPFFIASSIEEAFNWTNNIVLEDQSMTV